MSSSSLVDVDCVSSRIIKLRGLDTSHCLNILRPSQKAVNRKVAKHAPTSTEMDKWKSKRKKNNKIKNATTVEPLYHGHQRDTDE